MVRRLIRRLFATVRPARPAQDAAREIDAHLRLIEEDFLRRGFGPDDARRQARLALGGTLQTRERHHDARALVWLDDLQRDVRYALRSLRRTPGFTIVALLTLALGIGANAAIFSLYDALLLRSAPIRDPKNLLMLKWVADRQPSRTASVGNEPCFGDSAGAALAETNASGCTFSYATFRQFQSQHDAFESVAAFFGPSDVGVSGLGAPSVAGADIVSGEFFETIGVGAALGRTLTAGDDRPGAAPVVVLSYGYWQRALGGDPSVLGRTIRVNAAALTVVGVADRRFSSLSPGFSQDIWIPLADAELLNLAAAPKPIADPGWWWLEILARPRRGAPVAHAVAAGSAIFGDTLSAGNQTVNPLRTAIMATSAENGLIGLRPSFSKPLSALMLAVVILLIIVSVNLAGLILARNATRRTELGVRLAIGASRARLVRQLLTESLLLSIAGGILGAAAARGLALVLVTFVEAGALHRPHVNVAVDGRILLFTTIVTAGTGLLCGLIPALRSTRPGVVPPLEKRLSPGEIIGRAAGRTLTVGGLLVAAQVAISLLLLFGAGLLVRTLANLKRVDPGFSTENVLLFEVNPPARGYTSEQTRAFYRDLKSRLEALPGVRLVTYASTALLSDRHSVIRVNLPGPPPRTWFNADFVNVGPDFFETMGIPLVAGRTFTGADFDSGRAIAIVNQAFARRVLGADVQPGTDVTGTFPPTLTRDVVGVVADARFQSLRADAGPGLYFLHKDGAAHFAVRTASSPWGFAQAVRAVVGGLDADLPLSEITTQEGQIDRLLFSERLLARLGVALGSAALLLTCIGLYGLIACRVAQRKRDIGIRLAIGAQPSSVLRLVLKDGVLLVLLGVVMGVPAALAAGRLLAAFLFGVHATDPFTLAMAAALMLGVAGAAGFLPARRASKLDPAAMLRSI